MNSPPTLAELRAVWIEAKRIETEAQAQRLEIEAAILSLMPSKLEGSVTEAGLVVTYKVTRKVDTEALRGAWDRLPEAAQGAFRWKAEVDSRGLRALDPDDAKSALAFVTSTPAKPAISLKPEA